MSTSGPNARLTEREHQSILLRNAQTRISRIEAKLESGGCGALQSKGIVLTPQSSESCTVSKDRIPSIGY